MKDRTVIVILNYLNYKDTIECVDSILKMKYKIEGIVVVDNGSNNNSFNHLRAKYKGQKNVQLLKSKKNVGFARGNNIGITYARKKMKADYVLVCNNDTIFIDPLYITKLLSAGGQGIGIIDGQVMLKNGQINPRLNMYTTLLEICFYYFARLTACCNHDIGRMMLEKLSAIGRKEELPQGCALMFTPEYFKKFKGFYTGTFLYSEENILKILLNKTDLRLENSPEAVIYHKEDMSSKLSFYNDPDKMNRLGLQSYKHVILVKILPLKFLRQKKLI